MSRVRLVLWLSAGIFLLTRLSALMSFPIFNDEAIYIQYSQLIREDFGQYRLVSAGINMFADWKPPLQYWWGSIFVGITSDPLFGARLASFLVSVLGFFGIYLFMRELLGPRQGAVAALIYAICPTVLFNNNQFIAEAYVFSLAPWIYWSFLKAVRSEEIRIRYLFLAAIFAALTLLSKQSGAVYVWMSFFLALLAFEPRFRDGAARSRLAFWLTSIAIGVGLGMILAKLPISAESAAIRKSFDRNWLMSVPEIFSWPAKAWMANIRSVLDYCSSYYSVFMILPLAYFFYDLARRLDPRKMFLGFGFLGGSAAVILLLRGFNEYIYNTAVIVFLVPALAASFVAAMEAAKSPGVRRAAAVVILVSFAALAGHWIYQDELMKSSPADYIRRSTPWAIANYLGNWSSGFGVSEAVSYVKNQEKPSVVLADPQWGNPRTGLEAYLWDSSGITEIYVTPDFLTAGGTLAAKEYILKQGFKTRMAVFSSATNEERGVWQGNLEEYMCADKKEIQVEPEQPPILICSF